MNTIANDYDTVTEIPNEQLGDVLTDLFPDDFIRVEMGMYQALGAISADYQGGLWTGYRNEDNTLFFMVPPDKNYHLSVPSNYYEGSVSAEAAGLITSLMVINALTWKSKDSAHIALFYNLKNFALDHAEACEILAAID